MMYRLSPIFGRYLNAGTIMRDLRDPLLMHNGLHVVIVGTPDAIQAVVMAHQQAPIPPLRLFDIMPTLRHEYQNQLAALP